MAAVGHLGLGRMGSAIAGRMVDSGIDLTVWNRSPSAAQDDLVAAGAGVAETAAQALAKPVFFWMLADDSAADAVLVEAEGLPAPEFVELFTSTFFGGVIHSVYGGLIAERRYAPPSFTVGLGLKDLSLAERFARESQIELPLAPAIRERFEAVLADPQPAHLDWSAIAELGRPSGRPN